MTATPIHDNNGEEGDDDDEEESILEELPPYKNLNDKDEDSVSAWMERMAQQCLGYGMYLDCHLQTTSHKTLFRRSRRWRK